MVALLLSLEYNSVWFGGVEPHTVSSLCEVHCVGFTVWGSQVWILPQVATSPGRGSREGASKEAGNGILMIQDAHLKSAPVTKHPRRIPFRRPLPLPGNVATCGSIQTCEPHTVSSQ